MFIYVLGSILMLDMYTFLDAVYNEKLSRFLLFFTCTFLPKFNEVSDKEQTACSFQAKQ